MWPLCSANNFFWFILPMAIGLATGWWVWATAEKMPPRPNGFLDPSPEAAETSGNGTSEPVTDTAILPEESDSAQESPVPSPPEASSSPSAIEAEVQEALVEAPRVLSPGTPEVSSDPISEITPPAISADPPPSEEALQAAEEAFAIPDMPDSSSGLSEASFNPAPEAVGMSTLNSIASISPRHDDLTMIKGIGPKLNELLHELGIHRFAQIANWTAEDIARIDGQLGAFKGRVEREEWVEQADLLSRGELAAFELRYGEASQDS